MGKKDVRYSEESVYCNHCANTATMQFIGTVNDMREERSEDSPPYDYGDVYELLKCPVCKKATIRSYYWHDGYMEPGETAVQYEHLYPSPSKIPEGLPPHIKKAMSAAEKVRNIDANAFGVLIRRLLELVCIDRKASGRNLNEQLKDLSIKGEIPTNLVDLAHNLRVLGNIGAHAGSGDLSDDDLPILSSLSNAVLEYVYSAPHYAKMAQDAVAKKMKKR